MLNLYANPLESTGCRICELVCSLFYNRVLNPKKARLRVIRSEPGFDQPVACKHCEEPVCVAVCPVGAIRKSTKTRMGVIDQKICNGCKVRIEACPHEAMFFHPGKEFAMNCILCGECVKRCPVKWIKIVEEKH